jgi:hypothetical protein
MFDSELKRYLETDAELVSYVGTHAGLPSVFSEAAPEGVAFPYIVFRIVVAATEAPAVCRGVVFVDYYNYDTSRTRARKVAEKIEYLLDHKILNHDRYDSIRFFFSDGSFTPEPDPRAIHYNVQFDFRAGRKAWARQFA